MAACAKITVGSAINCDAPISGGTGTRIVICNFDDKGTATVGADGTISALALTGATVGYAFEGQKLSHHPSYELVKKPFINMFKHQIEFLVFEYNQTMKANLQKLAKGKVFAVVENNFQGTAGETAFEVYGYNTGLFLEELKRDANDTDNQGAITLKLSSDENGLESVLPQALFITSYAASKVIVDALLT
jgi:hypothetical protein